MRMASFGADFNFFQRYFPNVQIFFRKLVYVTTSFYFHLVAINGFSVIFLFLVAGLPYVGTHGLK